MNNSSLTFNLIYVKGTSKLLLPLVSTMLKYTNCSYRLVSNGCSKQEEIELENYANAHEKLSFYSLKSDTIKKHHSVLKELLQLEDSKYFAFIDSDMIAEADFVQEMLGKLRTHDAITTGLPIWHEEKDKIISSRYKIMGGKYCQSHNGIVLGVSYCAIYDRQLLMDFIRKTGISFDIYRWSQIPKRHQKSLEAIGLRKDFYDTGKVLNILLQQGDFKIAYSPVNGLIHIGGISGDMEISSRSNKLRHFMLANLPFKISGIIRSVYNSEYSLTIKESTDICYLAYRRRLTQSSIRNIISKNQKKMIAKKSNRLSEEYKQELEELATKIVGIHKQFQIDNL